MAKIKAGNTHDAVVMAVFNGKVDAGTVRTDTLERMADEGKIRLEDIRILNEQNGEFPFLLSTSLYPEWPMAATKTTPLKLSRQVAAALLAMNANNAAAKASKSAGWTIPLNYQPRRQSPYCQTCTSRQVSVNYPKQNWKKDVSPTFSTTG